MNSADISSEDAPLSKRVDWYRCPIDREVYRRLVKRSDALGLAQAGGHALLMVATAALALWTFEHHVWWTPLALFLHGTVCSFLVNAVHELIHGTVFKTRWLHTPFLKFFGFFGWQHYEVFNQSHARHHRYTLHPPDDLEVVLPQKLTPRTLLLHCFWNYGWLKYSIGTAWELARGMFKGEWLNTLFPEGSPSRKAPVRWARILLVGHGAILAVSIWQGWWLLPVLTSLTPLYGGWLHQLCNSTQHIGLKDNVSDFRLCCRTFRVNPLVRFVYWHMNYHIEHHMFAAVPCYNLHRLHEAIRHDLPPCQDGIVATWREIFEILRKQAEDPSYQFAPPLPDRAGHGVANPV